MGRHIAVWGIPKELKEALHRAAAHESLDLRTASHEFDAKVDALILHAHGASATAELQAATMRVRSSHRGSPIIEFANEPESDAGDGYAHARLTAAPTSAATASQLIRAAVDASRDYAMSLVGGSAAMRSLRAELRIGASAPSTVLLLGETGTGKGVAARALHGLSPRAEEPFETVDCAGLAPTLIESELFGHERGAFTGAHERHIGKLERAGCGTLFLDEIGELEVGLQTRLLRALEERVFERVGGSAPLPLRARVVAATHRDLWNDVAAGRFRRDLLYRLDILRIRLPALRERSEDIAPLTDHLLLRAAARLERPVPEVTAEFVQALRELPWEGNVRELANVIEALLVRMRGPELDAGSLARRPPAHLARETAYDEQTELSALLVECGGNVARVARRLGKPRSTVRSRIAQLGLSRLLPRD